MIENLKAFNRKKTKNYKKIKNYSNQEKCKESFRTQQHFFIAII